MKLKELGEIEIGLQPDTVKNAAAIKVVCKMTICLVGLLSAAFVVGAAINTYRSALKTAVTNQMLAQTELAKRCAAAYSATEQPTKSVEWHGRYMETSKVAPHDGDAGRTYNKTLSLYITRERDPVTTIKNLCL